MVTATKCARCGKDFPALKPSNRFCSRECMYAQRSDWTADNPLKARFLGELRSRHLSAKAASEEMRISYSTVRGWLQRPDSRLKGPALAAVATWLRISAGEALRLQGGDAESRRVERAVEGLHKSPKLQKHLAKLRTSPSYRRKKMAPMWDAVRGQAFTEDHKDKLSASLKAYREREDAHDLGTHHATERGRALQVWRSVRRLHPDWTPEQISAATIARLMTAPYNVATRREAWELIAPRWRHRNRRRGGPTPREHRHDIIDAIDAEYDRHPSGDRTPEAWDEFIRRVEEVEGAGSIDRAAAQAWLGKHAEHCTRIPARVASSGHFPAHPLQRALLPT